MPFFSNGETQVRRMQQEEGKRGQQQWGSVYLKEERQTKISKDTHLRANRQVQ